MKYRRIIIENRTPISDVNALRYVSRVIEDGRISDGGKQYCYHTIFGDGIAVSTDRNKMSDRFVVTQDPRR